MKIKVGSAWERSMRYSRQTRERMRLSFGTIMPPNARAKRKKEGNNQYSCDTSVLKLNQQDAPNSLTVCATTSIPRNLQRLPMEVLAVHSHDQLKNHGRCPAKE